jgi:hypothetical protein
MADRIDQIPDDLRELRTEHVKTQIAVAEFRCAQGEICKASIKQRETHDHVLFGNGKPGLVSVVQDMQTDIKRLKETPMPASGNGEVNPKNIILVPSCKHPDQVIPYRHGVQDFKACSLYKKLIVDQFFESDINEETAKTTADIPAGVKYEDYLPEPAEVIAEACARYST